jgi:hypothetical protein
MQSITEIHLFAAVPQARSVVIGQWLLPHAQTILPVTSASPIVALEATTTRYKSPAQPVTSRA